MADKILVKAEKREGRGKNDSRRLRRDGRIPISIYGGGGETLALTAPLSELAAVIRQEAGASTVFSIDIAGVGVSDVIFHDRQIDAIKGRLMHADLRRLQGTEAAEFEAKAVAEVKAAAEAAAEAVVAQAEAARIDAEREDAAGDVAVEGGDAAPVVEG
jgi:large subunit ribosomal protein L25